MSPYVLIMVAAAMICASIVAFVWFYRRKNSEAIPLIILLLGVTEWIAAALMGLMDQDLSHNILWAKIEYIGVVSVPLALLGYVLHHSGFNQKLNLKQRVWLVVIPVTTLVLAWTNENHELIWTKYIPYLENGLVLSDKTYGPGFWVYWVYSYLVLLAATFITFRSTLGSLKMFRWQNIVVIIAILAPWSGNLLYVLQINPFNNLDLTPLAFSISGILMAAGMFRWQLFDIKPIAYAAVLTGMADGLMILDDQDRIVEVNPSAQDILDLSSRELVGKQIEQVITKLLPPGEQPNQTREKTIEINLTRGRENRIYELSDSPFYEKHGTFGGRIIFFHDVTDRKRLEENLKKQHEILEELVEKRTIKLREKEITLLTRTHELGERVKELNCLYNISKLAVIPNLSLEEFLRLSVDLIPQGWQYPEVTCARIELDDRIFSTINFKESAWKQVSDIMVYGKRSGFLKVYYLEERPESEEGPFLMEERELIDAISEYVGNTTERMRAEENIRDYIQRIESLLVIDKVISSTLDLDEILNIVINELESLVPFDSLSVQMIQDNSLKIIACGGFDIPDDITGLSFPLDQKFPNSKVITTKKFLVIDDVAQEYPHFKEESDKYGSEKINSWLGLPLISKGTATGMISLDRHKIIPFTEFEIQMGTAISNQAALAIENAGLYKNAKRRLEQIGSLRKIDQAIASTVDLRVTMNLLIEHVVQQLDVNAAAVLLYRPHIDTLETVAMHGFRTKVLQSANLRLGEGFAGQAALERQIIKISDFNNLQTGYLRSPEFIKEEFVAYIGVPLLAKGKIIGVLEIFHRQQLNRDPEWMDFLETLAGQAAIAIDSINLLDDLQSTNVDLTLAYDATIEGWAHALELKDMETEGHSRRVVEMTMDMARRMGISGEKLGHIRRGALLHDIGKMGIPDSILQKPGKLNDEEWQIMRQHPSFAFEWLSQIQYLRPALEIPYAHHERWDGTGYPRGLEREQIPLEARIFALVDVWDALRSDRPYRKAWSKDKTLAHVKEQSGKHFDPRVVDSFVEMIKSNN